MKKTIVKRVEDPRLIAGLLKEAIYSQRQVSIQNGEQHYLGLITDLHEKSTRSKTETRSVDLHIESAKLTTQSISCTIGFPRFIATFDLELESTTQFTAVIPTTVTLTNHRDSTGHRFKVESETQTEVLLNTENLHCSALLSITDISRDGIGAIIETPLDFPINPNSRISGIVRIKSSEIKLNSIVARSQILETRHDSIVYSVGLYQDQGQQPPTEGSGFFHEQERRKLMRWETSLHLAIRTDLSNDLPIEGSIVNASVVGMLWEPKNPAHSQYFTVGMIVGLLDNSLRAQVVGFIGNRVRFEICDGTSQDRIYWLKFISVEMLDNLTANTYDPEALLDLFCVSGSFAAGLVKNQAKKKNQVVSSLHQDVMKQPWIHRWVQQSENGMGAHLSAIMLSDNLWFLADLVGGITEDLKISKSFVLSFFKSFAQTIRNSEPVPKLMLMWAKGHPYWNSINNKIKNSSYPFIQFESNYIRFPKEIKQKFSSIEINEVLAGDYILINKIRSLVNGNNLKILDFWDFTEDKFGSPLLKLSLNKSSGKLKRKYVLIKENGINKYFAILSDFPKSTSFNRTCDVSWLINLQSKKDNQDKYITTLVSWCFNNGIDTVGAFMPAEERDDFESSKTLLITITHPGGLSDL